jgi:TolB-like protein
VFISYARDDIVAAQRTAEALRSHGVEVWFDLDELRGGDAWDQKIRRQIRACTLFLPIISRRTQERAEGYFRLEWKLAVERTHLMAEGTPFLIPLVVDDISDAGAVVPAEFTRVQWTHLPGGLPTPAFIEQVKRLLSEPMKPAAPAAGSAATYKISSKSVAVLAFANLSQDPENEFFSDGISEEILNVIARIPGLRVAARTSAFSFKGRSAPVQEIARTLGVAHIVEGSVRRAGNRVRISAKLVSAADGFQIWSDTFDRELKDIFALQDEIAGLIARCLELKLGQAPRSAQEVNPEAYRLVLEARHFWSLRTDSGFASAEKAFLRAIEISPEFAQAHAGLADVYSIRSIFKGVSSGNLPAEDMERAKELATFALGLDPSLGEAHGTLAIYEIYARDFAAAERHFGIMLALNPNYAYGHLWHAHLFLARGRIDEALKAAERSTALDPLSVPARGFRSMLLNLSQRYDEAISTNDLAAALNDGPFMGFDSTRCFATFSLGRKDEAANLARKILFDDSPFARGWLSDDAAYVLKQTVPYEEACETVGKARAALPPDSSYHGTMLQALGHFEEALPFLEATPAVLQSRLYFHPLWDPVRTDARFHQLLAKLGCETEYKVGRETLAKILLENSTKR